MPSFLKLDSPWLNSCSQPNESCNNFSAKTRFHHYNKRGIASPEKENTVICVGFPKKLRSSWWLFPTSMAGSKELKIASEAMEQIKVHRALFQEALMWPPPQKRLRTVPRGSTYQGKLSSFIGSQCCLLLSLHWSINKKKMPAKMQSRLRKKLLHMDLKMVQKFDPQNGCRASKLISLSCIWKLGMTAKTGSKK